ncbi:Rv3235 family protein [Planotetraspora sp. GP83]|uniref:Rv3235 family protein n=1 Tax=Planotetraspora sp. GP83 TaxID=3156264 RepID=UPI003511CB91
MPKPIPLPRLVSVPSAEPPYDDEREVRGATPRTYGSLALARDPGENGTAASRGSIIIAPPGSLPDERRLRGLGQAVAEILCGRRPPETVQDRLSERAYRELIRAGRMIETQRPPLVGLPHIQQPRAGVVEMCLLIHCGTRSRVLALRLERYGVQWLVTDFETA